MSLTGPHSCYDREDRGDLTRQKRELVEIPASSVEGSPGHSCTAAEERERGVAPAG